MERVSKQSRQSTFHDWRFVYDVFFKGFQGIRNILISFLETNDSVSWIKSEDRAALSLLCYLNGPYSALQDASKPVLMLLLYRQWCPYNILRKSCVPSLFWSFAHGCSRCTAAKCAVFSSAIVFTFISLRPFSLQFYQVQWSRKLLRKVETEKIMTNF